MSEYEREKKLGSYDNFKGLKSMAKVPCYKLFARKQLSAPTLCLNTWLSLLESDVSRSATCVHACFKCVALVCITQVKNKPRSKLHWLFIYSCPLVWCEHWHNNFLMSNILPSSFPVFFHNPLQYFAVFPSNILPFFFLIFFWLLSNIFLSWPIFCYHFVSCSVKLQSYILQYSCPIFFVIILSNLVLSL